MDFYANSGIPFAYTLELPDFGQFGFQLPPSQVKQVRRLKLYTISSDLHRLAIFMIYKPERK